LLLLLLLLKYISISGIGVAQLIVSGLVSIYYNVILGWSIYYLFASIINAGKGLPWTSCDHWWNTNGPDQCQYHVVVVGSL